MMTSFEDIFKIFLSQIGDDILLELDETVVEELLTVYLEQSTSDFDKCKKDLSFDEECKNIVSDLDLNEKMILAEGMILYWLRTKIFTENILSDNITHGDYVAHSSSALLGKLMSLYQQVKYDYESRKRKYSWKDVNINS